MEAVREIVDGSVLSSVLSLPKSYQNRQLEIIVFPCEPDKNIRSNSPKMTSEELDAIVKGSTVESLIGIIPDTGKTLDDYKTERLSRYKMP
jgi:hypothetical protein